jgi:hypothetical protein
MHNSMLLRQLTFFLIEYLEDILQNLPLAHNVPRNISKWFQTVKDASTSVKESVLERVAIVRVRQTYGGYQIWKTSLW